MINNDIHRGEIKDWNNDRDRESGLTRKKLKKISK